MNSPVVILARILLAAIFLISAVNKAMAFSAVSSMMAKAGFPAPDVFLAATIVFEIVGGLLLVVGWQARLAALALAAFTLVAGIIFHGFWASPPEQFANQLNHFLKNVAIVGGLLLVAAWPAAADEPD